MNEPDPAGGTRISAYRLVKRKYVRSAFSGAGARLYGGRWNSIGTPMVYTSGSLALALLEWRVHLAQWPAPSLAVIKIEFDETLIWTPEKLPSSWSRMPYPLATAIFGDNWVQSQRSAIMRVCSAIVPDEWNYLLNPDHPDFRKIVIGKPRVLKTDSRLGPLA
jgi:RES domain-containing protein